MGSVNLDNTGSGSAITLSSDGTSLLLDGTAIGGGGGDPDLYRDNASSATTPVASGTNAVAIGNNSVSSGTDSMAIGMNTVAASTRAVVLGGSSQAYGINSVTLGFAATVQSGGTDSSALGTRSQIGSNATGATAIAKSYASGSDSFAAAITNNGSSYGATGANSITLGRLAKASNTGGNAIGWGATSTHEYSSAFGVNATTTNSHQVALGGSGYTVLVSGAYKFPTADGSANQVLQTNGSGVLSFATAVVASTTLGAVGTYAMMQNRSGTASIPAGNTVAGTGLSYHNINYSVSGTPAASGTWRVMGRFSSSGTGSLNAISVCVRIS
jgi:hypothetical protein